MNLSGVRSGNGRNPAALNGLAPWLSLAFVAACLATIPSGAPLTGLTFGSLSALGAASVVAARLDGTGRWRRIRLWPIAACLGSTALSIALSRAPAISLERSSTTALFAILAVASQVCVWDPRCARGVAITACAVVCAVSIDVVWQRISGASLWNDVPALRGRLPGSQGNANDLAVASLLLPIAMAAVHPGPRAVIWRMSIALAAVPAWWLSASRQALGAWVLAVAPLARSARRVSVAIVVSVALLLVLIAAVPNFRARAIRTWESGLGTRERLLAFGASLVAQRPLTGIGPGMFGPYHEEAALAGWAHDGQTLQKVGMPWVHCLPLEVACEYGFVGVLAFGGAVAFAIHGGLRAQGSASEARVSRGGAWVLVVLFTVGLIDFTFIKDWIRCVWWLALGLGMAGSSLEKSPTAGLQGSARPVL
jgi:hypothetical protein